MFSHGEEIREILRLQRETLLELREEKLLLRRLIHLLQRHPATGLTISQIGGPCMAITGIAPGGSGTFQVSLTPAGSVLKTGSVPAWAASDSTVTVTPSADGFTVVVGVPASDSASSFDLRVTATSVDASGNDLPLAAIVTVPVNQAPPPPPVFATGLSIDQIA